MAIQQPGLVINQGDFRMQDWLLRAKISSGAKFTYSVLATYAGGKDHAWPSLKTLSEKISLSERTVQRHLNELIRFGLIEKFKQYIKGRVQNCYRFLRHAIIGVTEKIKAQNVAVFPAPQPSGRHDKLSHCPPEPLKILPSDTTNCPGRHDNLSPSLNKVLMAIEENNNNPPTPLMASAVAKEAAGSEFAGKGGDLILESEEEKPGELQKEAGKALAEAETALAEVKRAYDEAAGEKRDEDPDWIRAKKAMEAELDSCITVWRMNSLIFERSGTAVILRAANSFTICQVKKELSSHISKALADIGFSEWKLELFNAEQQKAHTEQQEKSEKLRRELERAEARVKEAARAKAKAAEEAKLEALSPDEKFELLFETYPVKKERNGAKNVFMGLFSEGKLPPMAELFRSIKEHLEKDAWWRTKMPPLLKNWLEKEKWMDVPYGY